MANERRQLAAIMFADMVGYTALMQEDEGEARAQRDAHRAIQSAAVTRYHGTVLEHYGDGTLSIFASAVEAVECSIEVQREVAQRPLIPLRIGVHTGDIVHDDAGIYGDGVNVASRIEGLSAPGGVMVSGKVYDEIKNHSSIEATPIGAVKLKNVGQPLSVYAISNQGLVVPATADVRATAADDWYGAVDLPVPAYPKGTVHAEPMGAGEAFLQRVRERALIPWGLVYVAGAWVMLVIIRFSGDRLSWSPLIPQGAALLAFIGFFVTLVVAWFHGERGRQKIQRVEVAIIAILAVAASFALSTLPSSQPAAGNGNPTFAPVSDDRPSVAALPWVNRSGLAEDAYFTDGIHDEILTRLSKIGGLRVISRQSVVQFRDSPLTPGEIAQRLGVQYILEAGLLRVRDTVRLNVTLTDARTGDVAWSESQDRRLTLDNLLSIQTEIAQTIADTLRATVTPAERVELARRETENLEAYDYYLQGRNYYLRPGYLRDNFEAAQSLFERAIALDPGFAMAHAALSRVHGQIYWERFDPSDARLQAQRTEAEQALRLQPDLPQALLAIGWAHYVRGDFPRALSEFEAAKHGMPNDAEIVALIGYTHRRLGDWPQVFAAFDEATRLNPRDATLFYDLGGHSFAVRRMFPEAIRAYDRALRLAPDLYDAALRKGDVYLHWQGQRDTMRAVIAGLPRDLHIPEVDLARVDLALWDRDPDALLRLVEAEPAPVYETQLVYYPKSLYAAWAYRLRGDETAAQAAFDSTRRILEPLAARNPTDGRIQAALGFAYAGLHRIADAERSADMASRAGSGYAAGSGPHASVTTARIMAQAGIVDRTVQQLDQLLAGSTAITANTLRLDPLFDPVRRSPVFQRFLSSIATRPGSIASDPSNP